MLTRTDIETIKKLLEPIKKSQRKTHAKLDALIGMYDVEYRHQRKRVDRIEEHLNLSELPHEI